MKSDRWEETEEIYQQAQQREGQARSAFLDEACAEDAELRSQVEARLKADFEPANSFDTPAMKLAAQVAAEQQRSLVGKRISHYEVVERIGAGGMGEVYRARDIRLGRDVAVKILPARFAVDEALRRRFEREARA